MSLGRFAVDWETRINIDRMRKERLERARKHARERGIEVMLLLGGDNARYVAHNLGKANTRGASGNRFVLFPVNREPTLYEFGMWSPYVHDRVDWINVKRIPSFLSLGPPEARQKQYKKAAAEIRKAITESGVRGEQLHADVYNSGLASALKEEGITLATGADEAVAEARKIKTPDEVECQRSACSIAEGGFEKLRTSIRPGMTETELRGIFVGEMYRLGMEFVPSGEITSGPRTFVNSVTTSDRLVRYGDAIIAMACSSSFLGYKICYYRTFVCGRASQNLKDCYFRTKDILDAGAKTLKPGNTTKDIADKWPKAEEFGYHDEDEALWIQWGHGIGVTNPEDPTASRLWSLDHPQRIEEGMTMALETWFPTGTKSGTYPRGQSTRIEEMFHVTSGGVDQLTTYPSDEIIECT